MKSSFPLRSEWQGNVIKAMFRADISQKQMAGTMGVSRQYFNRLMNSMNVTDQARKKIEAALQIRLEEKGLCFADIYSIEKSN